MTIAAPGRVILHVDMDAFYAAVEQRDEPRLRGRPVIVGGSGGRGVVAAASYEVRRFGVHSAMPVREALRRCPEAICVKPRMSHYQSVSQQIFAIFREYTPLVEGLSLDEAFLDVTASQAAFGPGPQIARAIKRRIREHTALTASVGVAPNKLVAKIASDLEKPDGLVVVGPDRIHVVLDPLPIERLSGLGRVTAPRVAALGIRTLGELRRAPVAILRPVFGRHAERIQQRAAGCDDRAVIADWDEKQVSTEETFDSDLTEPARLHAELARLADRAAARLRAKSLASGCVSVKIRRGDFRTFTRQHRFQPPTRETRVIATIAGELLGTWLASHPRAALRLLGVALIELVPAAQLELFAAPESQRNTRLDRTLDEIRAKFGTQGVVRASSLGRNSRRE
jgi:DNA polymerase IV